jgi:hypothetical protein
VTHNASVDDLLDPILNSQSHHPASYTQPLSSLTDAELDKLIIELRTVYGRAGITMLDGMLRNIGHRVPRERIRGSLLCIDPVHWVFQCIRICHRVYSVPGPNALCIMMDSMVYVVFNCPKKYTKPFCQV